MRPVPTMPPARAPTPNEPEFMVACGPIVCSLWGMGRRKRVYVGLLGCALSSLVVDRVLLAPGGGPARASAAEAFFAGQDDTRNEPLIGELDALLSRERGMLASRLAMLQGEQTGGRARDAFGPRTLFVAGSAPQESKPAPGSHADYVVTSVILGRSPMAFINGRLMREGDSLDERTRVVSISQGTVRLEREGVPVDLPVVREDR